MKAHRLGLLACLLLLGGGCERCDREAENVPFGRDRTPRTEPEGETNEAPSGFLPREGAQLDPGTREISVAGGRYGAARGDAIRVVLRLDLDQDDDEDALLVLSQETALSLVAVRNDRGVLVADALGTFPIQEGCLFDSGRLEQIAPETVLLGLSIRCPFGEASAGAMLSLVPSARIRKKLWLDGPRDESQPALRQVVSSEDRDEDGHLDLVVAVIGESTPPVELVWLNRPGGLALADDEPRRTLESVYVAAHDATSPDVTHAEAGRLRSLAVALCREAESPRLRVDETYGVPCGKDFVRLADALRVRALIAEGRFDDALALDRALREGSEEEVQKALDEAWGAVRAAKVSLTRIADAPMEGGVDEWTAGLAFEDDRAVVRRGLLTQRYTVEGKSAEAEVVVDRGLPITDLAGRFGVESLVRDCASVRARIVPLDPETGAVAVGGTRREIEVAPPEPRCERGSNAPRTWEILGWTPQGLIARNGARRRVVPLGVDAQPSGDPFDLAPEEPLPSPILGAHVSRDGTTQLDTVPGAVLVTRDGAPPLVIRDESWGPAPAIRAAALSSDGDRIAAVVGDGLYVGRLPRP